MSHSYLIIKNFQTMELKYIGTCRKFAHWPSWDLVYEWEDILSKELAIDFCFKNSWYNRKPRKIPLLNLFLRHWTNTFCFEMSACVNGPRMDNMKTVVPCIIDFFLTKESMPLFVKKYCNNNIVLLSSKESYDFVADYIYNNNIQNFNIGHLALSISDKYAINNTTFFDKKYDLVLMGRQNAVLEGFLNQYIINHTDLYYVYRELKDGKFNYYTNRGECLGDINTRDKYITLMRSARCGLYSTPGIDGGEKRTNGFSQVTPRFLELIACGCHVIARYKRNSDTDYYELEKFSPSVESYEQFERMLDKARSSEVDIQAYSNYLSKHYTSVRAIQLKEIIKNY